MSIVVGVEQCITAPGSASSSVIGLSAAWATQRLVRQEFGAKETRGKTECTSSARTFENETPP